MLKVTLNKKLNQAKAWLSQFDGDYLVREKS
jgi:hypothetical protein